MGIWGSVKNAAEKTKVRGDIALTQRGVISRKKKFGEELYDCLTNDKQKLLGVSAGTLTVFKKGSQNDELKGAFERSRDDIRGKQARKDELQNRLDVMEVKGSHTMPDATIGQKMSKTGKMFSNAGIGTKIRAQMTMIDREIKSRKGEFGLEVFDLAKTSEDKQKKGLKGKLSTAISSLSDHEKEIQKIVDAAKNDVEEIEERVKGLERKISILDSETEPLTCS
mmetsp:Transcript_4626/g.11881  ORF Transcript_4626/g.11881 Transcript_4626/m.11881 type:complete len:224 (-) Transcript_4626:188-859(-)|eukprot:CAMPEP_0197186032 /NCGR_PEP_ID=MMETSP1423-20130617/13067_1 /TAXON_ID=476441 /ORGANISM="Pseudo-nitzschia heimii, Strain UNC1101" /LENGTH=223 /DNA_ID=CAMNT_0042637231 /DNA_START=46 /DNA_END=717 /DNA_ORIENTATION=+